MSNYNPAMNFIPGPDTQQPGSHQSHQYPASTMSFPHPNPHIYPNPIAHSHTPPNPNIFPNPAMMPNPTSQSNPGMFPNQFQPSRTSPNFPNPNVTINQSLPPNPSMSTHVMPNPMEQVPHMHPIIPLNFSSTPAQDTLPKSPNMDITSKPSSSPISNAPINLSPTDQVSVPINLPIQQTSPPTVPASPPTSQTSPRTIQTSPLTSQSSPSANKSSPVTLPQTSIPETIRSKSPTIEASPPTNQSSGPTTQSTSPNIQSSPPTSPSATQSSPPTESQPSTSNTSPKQDQTPAGNLEESVRRSKRKTMSKDKYKVAISALIQPSPKKSRTMPAKITYDDYEDDDEDSECPKEYLIENAYTDRLRFNNHVAKTVYKKEFDKFDSKPEFQKYLAGQQKWRWELNNIVMTLDTRVHNMCVNRNSGIAQNVQRYSSIPLNCKSDDVRRCEKTSKELEKMIFRTEQTKEDMEERRKLLFDLDRKPSPGEIDFMDEIVKKVDNLKTVVEEYHSNCIDTLQNICKRFTTESVEAAEIRRQKRRKRENLKKKRKSQERSLEKKVIDVLLRLVSKEVAERILTGSDAPKISVKEMNGDELLKITNGSNNNDLLSLHTILVREYLDEAAAKLVKQKLAECA